MERSCFFLRIPSKRKILPCRNQQKENCADGRLSAACASLISDALVDPTEENVQKLKEKHPFQDIPSDLPSASECDPIFIEPSLVLKKLRSFNKGSAAGPSGIKANHILSAVQLSP